MLLSRHQNSRQNPRIKRGNRLFENVFQLKYMGTILTNKNFVSGENEEDIELW
jgi:hypothetical protein